MIAKFHRYRGFTLLELMISMVIGSIVLLTAAYLIRISGEGYERIGGGVSAEREARAVIGQLTSDLSTAIYHKDGILEKSTKSWSADRLGFLCLQPAGAQSEDGRIGDLCAVGYYIEDLTIGGRTVRCLMRGFRESRDTFDALEAGAVSPLFAKRGGIDEPVAFGVVSFSVRPKTRDAVGKWTDWIVNDGEGPEALAVGLVICRRSLGGRLITTADWDGDADASPLGMPMNAPKNPELETYGALIRYGNHEAP